jgi:hypothetical protein
LNRQKWYRARALAALTQPAVPRSHVHKKPWTMSKAREKARRVRQMERKRWKDSLPRVNQLMEEYGERQRKKGGPWIDKDWDDAPLGADEEQRDEREVEP